MGIRWSFRDNGDSFTVKRTTETTRKIPGGTERVCRTTTSTAATVTEYDADADARTPVPTAGGLAAFIRRPVPMVDRTTTSTAKTRGRKS